MMNARQAWCLLAAGVVVFDILAAPGDTLSEQVDVWLVEHPVVTTAVVATVSLHLLNVLPPSFDPLHVGFATIRKVSLRGT